MYTGAVFCLEINVNGQRRVIAGGPAAEVINATVSLYPGLVRTESVMAALGEMPL